MNNARLTEAELAEGWIPWEGGGDMVNLKPCPWQDRHEEPEDTLSVIARTLYIGGEGFCVQCTQCMAMGPWAPTEYEAIKNWGMV
jgi:hypothetical protein